MVVMAVRSVVMKDFW
jgi:hypothetical protein